MDLPQEPALTLGVRCSTRAPGAGCCMLHTRVPWMAQQ